MSAQLAAAAASSNNFSAHLQLADGATASIHAPTLTGLRDIVAKLQPTEAVNDPVAVKPAATPAAHAGPAGAAGGKRVCIHRHPGFCPGCRRWVRAQR
jgi:hypothetical protein